MAILLLGGIFPLNAPAVSYLSSTGVQIDLRAFRRAYALLVLQGIQLLRFEQGIGA